MTWEKNNIGLTVKLVVGVPSCQKLKVACPLKSVTSEIKILWHEEIILWHFLGKHYHCPLIALVLLFVYIASQIDLWLFCMQYSPIIGCKGCLWIENIVCKEIGKKTANMYIMKFYILAPCQWGFHPDSSLYRYDTECFQSVCGFIPSRPALCNADHICPHCSRWTFSVSKSYLQGTLYPEN